MLEVTFRPYYWLKYPTLVGVKAWHTLNRVRPFSYERKRETHAKVLLLGLVLLVVVTFSLLTDID